MKSHNMWRDVICPGCGQVVEARSSEEVTEENKHNWEAEVVCLFCGFEFEVTVGSSKNLPEFLHG